MMGGKSHPFPPQYPVTPSGSAGTAGVLPHRQLGVPRKTEKRGYGRRASRPDSGHAPALKYQVAVSTKRASSAQIIRSSIPIVDHASRVWILGCSRPSSVATTRPS